MNEYEKWYWDAKLIEIQNNLQKNRFAAYICDTAELVVEKAFSLLESAKSIGLGGSLTLSELNIPKLLVEKNYNIINPPDKTISPDEFLEKRRQSLLADAYFCSTNAITEDGLLVNIDCISNRVAAMMFGPKKVIIIAGINKIVKDTSAALTLIKSYTAPQNAKRLKRDTPCVKTAKCMDCRTAGRICCNTVIMGFQHIPERIHILLVKQRLGI